MNVAAAMFEDLGWRWLPSYRADPRAAALYRRHYSAEKNGHWSRSGIRDLNFMGPGETMVLLSPACDALFAWQRNVGAPRLDGQEGVNCTVFRNEGPTLSSDLIREASGLAWQRWPGERLFTYVDGEKTRRRRSKRAKPGACFIHAGWTLLEQRSKGRGLYLLECVPGPAGSARQRAVGANHSKGGHSDVTAPRKPGQATRARGGDVTPLVVAVTSGHDSALGS